jgi:hypothetical protein
MVRPRLAVGNDRLALTGMDRLELVREEWALLFELLALMGVTLNGCSGCSGSTSRSGADARRWSSHRR